MILLYAVAGAGITACALFMILSRNLVRMLLGFSLLATAVNLLLFLAGGAGSGQPPIIADDAETLGAASDPTIQAMILTAIVIGFALTVMTGVLILRTWRAKSTLDARKLEAASRLGAPRTNDPTDA